MGSTHAGHNPADKWPLMPSGGYLRAIPRDALTGEPIRPDTIHKRVRPDVLSTRDNGPHGAPTGKRSHHARQSPADLPTLVLHERDDAWDEGQATDDE